MFFPSGGLAKRNRAIYSSHTLTLCILALIPNCRRTFVPGGSGFSHSIYCDRKETIS